MVQGPLLGDESIFKAPLGLLPSFTKLGVDSLSVIWLPGSPFINSAMLCKLCIDLMKPCCAPTVITPDSSAGSSSQFGSQCCNISSPPSSVILTNHHKRSRDVTETAYVCVSGARRSSCLCLDVVIFFNHSTVASCLNSCNFLSSALVLRDT